jgi:hypothetical protein
MTGRGPGVGRQVRVQREQLEHNLLEQASGDRMSDDWISDG